MQPTPRLLRHGARDILFSGVRAPSTLGSHLRSYTWGNVLQLEKAGRELLARLARRAPLLPGADALAFIDIDSTQKRVYGHKKQGARFGHTKFQDRSMLVRGLNALVAAVRRSGARFSVTAPVNAGIRTAIATIPEDAWQAISYPQAIWDDQLGCRVSDAGIAETPYAAFTSKKKELHVTARLIVRRVRDKNPKARTARHSRDRLTLHLPEGWHREREWTNLFETACGPPAAAA